MSKSQILTSIKLCTSFARGTDSSGRLKAFISQTITGFATAAAAVGIGSAVFAAILMFALSAVAQTTPAESFIISDVRVFDGTRVREHQDVVVNGGKIASLSPHSGQKTSAGAPSGLPSIDGRGKTLLPGLIDSHTHVFSAEALQQSLIFGVTTDLDMFANWKMIRDVKAQLAAGTLKNASDVRSAGTLATAPGGHGTEYGMPIPTLTTPAEAQAWVDARIAEGSDYIKIIDENGAELGVTIPNLTKETMAAIVTAAHARGKMAVVHVSTLVAAREAIDAGADGLAHIFFDVEPDAGFGKFVAAHHAFVIPTLVVDQSITGGKPGEKLLTDTALAPFLDSGDVQNLKKSFNLKQANDFHGSGAAVAQLKAAGVPILAGTDAPNPGTTYGASLHQELALLVEAGLTPTEALTAATSTPAKTFHLFDRGRIAPGLRADLLLIDGDPTRDILDTRKIEAVWEQGIPADRATFAAKIAKDKAAVAAQASAPPLSLDSGANAGPNRGLVSDFEAGTLTANFGAGWMETTDAMAGGASVTKLNIAGDGAQSSQHSLSITGEIKPGFAYPWAGAMFSPGSGPFATANLSRMSGISFWAKGDGQSARVMLFAQANGRIPMSVEFTPAAEWKEFTFPFASFGATDGHDIQAVLFVGGPKQGKFTFSIDNVRFVPAAN